MHFPSFATIFILSYITLVICKPSEPVREGDVVFNPISKILSKNILNKNLDDKSIIFRYKRQQALSHKPSSIEDEEEEEDDEHDEDHDEDEVDIDEEEDDDGEQVAFQKSKEQTESQNIKKDKVPKNGVQIDFKYNETLTKSDPNRLISAPGCPKSMKGIIYESVAPWVYYGNDGKCYLTGIQGPCPDGMKLSIESGTKQGICKCDCFFPDGKRTYTWDPLNQTRPYCFDGFDHYTFVSSANRCHKLLSQGPCQNGELLILDPITNSPKCEKRKCPEDDKSTNERYFVDSKSNSCKVRGSLCCETSGSSPETCSSAYLTDEINWLPTCQVFTPKALKPISCDQFKSFDPDGVNLYDTKTKKYYSSKCNGPCNSYSTWKQPNASSNLGACSCLYGTCNNLDRNSPIVRSVVDNECHLAYHQGPCREGEWLTYDKKFAGVCTPNPCIDESDHTDPIDQKVFDTYFHPKNSFRSPFWFQHKGKCYRTYSQGPCKNGEIFLFLDSQMEPTCIVPDKSSFCPYSSTYGGGLHCETGFKQHKNDCVPNTVNYDLD